MDKWITFDLCPWEDAVMKSTGAITASFPTFDNNRGNLSPGEAGNADFWSRQDALALYQNNEDYTLLAVNRFLRQYPRAVSSVRDKEDLLSDARLVLWHCCERYDPTRGARITTLAFKAIYRRLLENWKQGALRMENGCIVPAPKSIPFEEGKHDCPVDKMSAQLPGGHWGSEGLTAILHRERLQKAQSIWASRDSYRQAKSPVMAAELEAVLSVQYLQF